MGYSFMNEHPQDPFIFVTPYLDEIERIKNGTKATFYDPQNFQRTDLLGGDVGQKTKLEDFNDLLTMGRNVVTTHKTFCNASSETIQIPQDNSYNLVIDESVDVLIPMNDLVDTPNTVNKRDAELMCNNGLIQVDEDCRVHWTGGSLPVDGPERHKYCEVQRHANNGTLLLVDKQFFVWEYPVEVFESILVDGSYMGAYLRLHGMQYDKVSVAGSYGQGFKLKPYAVDMEQRRCWEKLITLYEDDTLVDYGPLSVTWYNGSIEKHPKSPEAAKLRNGLRRFFRGVQANPMDTMWTCPKSSRDVIAPKGYKITRELTEDEQKGRNQVQRDQYIDNNHLRCWVASTARATNNFRDRHVLAFMQKVSPNPEISKYFGRRGASLSSDMFALSVLIQWVWRSAIRDGEPITLYLPSPRMKRLFQEWLDGKR